MKKSDPIADYVKARIMERLSSKFAGIAGFKKSLTFRTLRFLAKYVPLPWLKAGRWSYKIYTIARLAATADDINSILVEDDGGKIFKIPISPDQLFNFLSTSSYSANHYRPDLFYSSAPESVRVLNTLNLGRHVWIENPNFKDKTYSPTFPESPLLLDSRIVRRCADITLAQLPATLEGVYDGMYSISQISSAGKGYDHLSPYSIVLLLQDIPVVQQLTSLHINAVLLHTHALKRGSNLAKTFLQVRDRAAMALVDILNNLSTLQLHFRLHHSPVLPESYLYAHIYNRNKNFSESNSLRVDDILKSVLPFEAFASVSDPTVMWNRLVARENSAIIDSLIKEASKNGEITNQDEMRARLDQLVDHYVTVLQELNPFVEPGSMERDWHNVIHNASEMIGDFFVTPTFLDPPSDIFTPPMAVLLKERVTSLRSIIDNSISAMKEEKIKNIVSSTDVKNDL